MKSIATLLIAMILALPLQAQEVDLQKRANHYIDHIVLGINDLEAGMDAFTRLTGVEPEYDGGDEQLGTRSAIVGLGDEMFLEIIAPDTEVDPETLDPELRRFVHDRLLSLDELRPFKWSVGTSNLERTEKLLQRSRGRPSEFLAGSRKRGWGREQAWRWLYTVSPESAVTPVIVQWADENKRPQERAPEGCTLEGMEIFGRNYKTLRVMMTTLQVEAELEAADEDSLRFELDCPGGKVVFDHFPLKKVINARPN